MMKEPLIRLPGEYDRLAPTEIYKQYPEGIFFYYYPNKYDQPDLNTLLQHALPHYFIVFTTQPFPADIGTQIGNYFYGDNDGTNNLIIDLLKYIKNPEQLLKYLPLLPSNETAPMIKNYPQIGGNLVFVNDTTQIVTARPNPVSTEEKRQVFIQNNHDIIDYPWLYKLIQDLSRKYPHDWTFRTKHIDLLLTGFNDYAQGIQYFMDEILFDTISSSIPFTNLSNIISVPHEHTLQGALNLSYIPHTDSSTTVLVPAISTLGKIGDYLSRNGHTIIEVGTSHVDRGGGPKCRSQRMHWRT